MAIGRISGPMLFSNLERQGVDLAFDSNLVYLDVANRRVGITNTSPQYVIDSPGNVKLANILIQGNLITSNAGKVNLGSTSNFTIAGGSANYVLTTDGDGNLSWNEISNLDIQWGNLLLANNTISIADTNGNLNLQANGTGNVVTINDFYAGNVYALNIVGTVSSNGGAFTGNVTAPYFLGNLIGNTINANTTTTVTGNTQSWYATDLNSTNGNITTLVATNISTGNAVISGGYISTLTNAYITTSGITNLSTGNAVISGGYISALSNITVITGNTESWYATALNSTDGNVTTLVVTNFSSANAIITGGNVTANISGNITGTFGSFSGNVDAPWFIGNVAGTIANFLGNVYANANLAVAGNLTVSGNLTALGNVIARQITSPVGDLHISAATNDPNNIIRFDSVSAFDIPSGTTAQRPPTPDYGYVRYNTDIGSIEWWSGAAWVAGQDLIVSETINPDGTNATYTLGQSTSENAILVNINGTIQQAASGAYTVVGDQITFSETPLVTDIIEIRYLAGGVAALSWQGGNVTYPIRIANTTVSTSTSTGALVVAGGTGIDGNLHLGGNVNLAVTSGTPGNTASPASWLKVYVGGTAYFMPLYQ